MASTRNDRKTRGHQTEFGGPGRNRTATVEDEGFTDPWAHHLPDRPTTVTMPMPIRGTRRLGAAAILPDSGMVRRVRSETEPSLTGLRTTIIWKRGNSLPHPRNFHPTLMSAAEHAVSRSFAAGAIKGKRT